jgi:hypothetical protein
MGGRRAGSLSNLVGSGRDVAAAKRRLSRAVTKEDPSAIAEASINLVEHSNVGIESLRLGLKLAPYVSENAAELATLSGTDREERIRAAWADIKRRENLQTPREVDSAVVNAAKAAFAKRRGSST